MSKPEHGRLIVVVGASGAGKDSVIRAAQKHFKDNPKIAFVRRIITRECNPAAEVHDSVSEDEFKQSQARGDFSVWWHANGLYYGLPATVHTDIEKGRLLIANGSRGALTDIRSQFSNLLVVHVVTSPEALAKRLERRSRENAEEIDRRLQRNRTIAPLRGDDVVTIDNSGERHVAIDEFIALLDSLQTGPSCY